ncbi:MAG: Rieske (2Fe-2S) protein, partial [Nocardioides sp.]
CGGAAAPEAGSALATTDEVPVGGGLVLGDQNIVITQPTEGDFQAFGATCTHQGTAISRVGDDGMECDLHGSRFSIADGSATRGPASEALPRVAITVEGDQILAA